MPDTVTDFLDLALALRRVKHEISRDRCFGVHPHELRLVAKNEASWLDALRNDLSTGDYEPGPLDICHVPKPKGAIRPGGRLSLRDHVVYTACVGFYSPTIRQLLVWPDRPRDFSHPIAPNPGSYHWLDNPFGGWKQFGVASLIRIAQGASHVAITDIAGFYEHIDIALMLSDVRAVNDNNLAAQLLSKCLNKWSLSQVPGRGLPQGYAASDILARLYLHAVDSGLNDRGVFHYRYVDDFRLFALSLPEARKALVHLIVLLRKRGLVLQTAKSGIHVADAARADIEGVQPVLVAALKEYVHDIADLFGVTDPYFSLWEAEELIAANPDGAPIEIMQSIYTQHIVEGNADDFDKTLFHFLLTRFRNASDDFAFPHCLTLLAVQPQETAPILRYVAVTAPPSAVDAMLVAFLRSPDNVYWYQVHQIISWRTSVTTTPSTDFVAYVREVAFNLAAPSFVRSTAREFVARFGSSADIDRLEEALSAAVSDLERAELVCAIRRMEPGRRNSILARMKDESFLVTNAVALVRLDALD
ncbi:MAG: hypothetical protein JWM41_1565 [Gemmatimonadetes bacterium]|nr:hypothetical protein [Gemmatimonadota bacterium]